MPLIGHNCDDAIRKSSVSVIPALAQSLAQGFGQRLDSALMGRISVYAVRPLHIGVVPFWERSRPGAQGQRRRPRPSQGRDCSRLARCESAGTGPHVRGAVLRVPFGQSCRSIFTRHSKALPKPFTAVLKWLPAPQNPSPEFLRRRHQHVTRQQKMYSATVDYVLIWYQC